MIPAVALFPVTGGMAPPVDAAEEEAEEAEEDAPTTAEEAEDSAPDTAEEAAEVAELRRESMAPVAVLAPSTAGEEAAASAAASAGAEVAAASPSAAALLVSLIRHQAGGKTYGDSWARTARAGTRAARNNVFAYMVNIVGLLLAFSWFDCSVKERLKRRKQVSHFGPLYIG